MVSKAVVAAAGRNRKIVVVQSRIMNALDWEPASEILHCCYGFQHFYSTVAAFLFLLVSGRRCITAKLSKLLKLKGQQKSRTGNRKLNNFYYSSTCWGTKNIWAADFRLLPWWNPSGTWIIGEVFLGGWFLCLFAVFCWFWFWGLFVCISFWVWFWFWRLLWCLNISMRRGLKRPCSGLLKAWMWFQLFQSKS